MNKPTALSLLPPAVASRQTVLNFTPMVLFGPRKGPPQIALLLGPGDIAELLAATLAEMRAMLGPAEWIAVTIDTYTRRVPEGEVADFSGTLRERFVAGDMETFEQLVVLLIDRYRGIDMAAQTYRQLPDGAWEWDDPKSEESPDGRLVDIIRTYM